jgi:hypothetical protein
MNRTLESALRKQVQLPEAMFQEGNERVVCSGLYLLLITLLFNKKQRLANKHGKGRLVVLILLVVVVSCNALLRS